MDSTVVSKPRLPKKSVGACGCFCAERTRCANLDWPLPRAAGSSGDTPGFAGRPSKLPPVLLVLNSARRTKRTRGTHRPLLEGGVLLDATRTSRWRRSWPLGSQSPHRQNCKVCVSKRNKRWQQLDSTLDFLVSQHHLGMHFQAWSVNAPS